MIKSALIREYVMGEAKIMCKRMQVMVPCQFPEEAAVYNVLQLRDDRDLMIAITEAVMLAFGAEPSRVKDPRFDKTHRAANKLTKKLRGGEGVEA